MRILLAEDDRALGRALADGLRHLGHAVDWVEDGRHALHAFDTTPYAAAVLDWNLPRMSGVELIATLRHRGDRTPVLLLTARDAVDDRIAGLDCGADDYVVKPVHLEELAARMRALLRRGSGDPVPRQRLGALELDPSTRSAQLLGAPLELSPREYALLESLAAHPGRALSRPQLEEAVYGWGEEVASNAIEVHVHHLRRKLGPGWVRTLRGVGYALYPPDAAVDAAGTPP
ncbi:response regulator transcription factor [Luteimonas sp. MC1828]|uniref:response regulator transcription factor n=1 Tax=Luteimonas sp. MC1828 TaxID=2799787 RepID=UPI0018F25AD6|nr:response regulator transcription factor [Luteimonas sp. MC1828]MBJ7574173.1 response regulator transcription factor [Luteimonas sp. MC1828]